MVSNGSLADRKNPDGNGYVVAPSPNSFRSGFDQLPIVP